MLRHRARSDPDDNEHRPACTAAEVEQLKGKLALAEAACRDSERRYSRLFEGSRDAIIAADAAGLVVEANQAALDLLGYARDEIIGADASLLHAYPDRAAAFLEKLVEPGFVQEFEVPLRRSDGSVVSCLFSATAVHSDSGRLLGFHSIIHDITARRAVEEALRISETRFRTLVESIGEGVVAVDTAERFTFANRAAGEIFGVDKDDLLYKSLRDFLSDDDWKTVLGQTDRRNAGEQGRYELNAMRADGSVRNIVVNAAPRYDDSGRYVGATSVFFDITDAKEAERARHESEVKYRSLFEESQDVIYITSLDGELLDISPSAETLFDYTREELIEMDVKGLYPDPEDRRRFQEEIERTGSVRSFPVRLRTKAGGVKECLLTSTVSRDPDGATVGYQGIIRDVTERNRAERARERSRAAFRIIAEAAVAADGIPDLCSRALEGLIETYGFDFGTVRFYNEESLTLENVAVVGMPAADLDKFSDQRLDDPSGIAALVARTGRSIFAPDIDLHDVARTHAARLRELSVSALVARPIVGSGGDLLGVLQLAASRPAEVGKEDESVFQTISEMFAAILERARAVEDREQMRAQLLQAQKMEAIGTLASGVAHDFNNLLTAVQGFADLALMSVDESTPLHSDLEKIRSSAERGSSLVRQLLLFSRRQSVELAPIDLNTTTQGLMRMLAPLIGEDIAMSLVLDPDAPVVMADEAGMQQVLMNLAVNARDAMPHGGELSIRIETVELGEKECADIPESRPGRFVRLSVEDTGVGMSDETIARIFEPFFSTKSPAQGTGLGLAVVYGIVKQHGGWMFVQSSSDAGSAFHVYLPASTAAPDGQEASGPSVVGLAGRGERILVVEDEHAVRDFAVKVLRRSGYVVFEAETVKEALGLLESEGGRFDLIFSDVVLPDRSGFQLAEHLSRANPSLPVLLSSGHADEKSQWEAIRDKGLPFLEKPYSLPDLLRAVRESVHPN
jgi:two-component system cell cycle sensor histidine kinase/response regulator CckA